MNWTNPVPFSLGGGPSDIAATWRALRALEGGEHGPGPENGFDDAARQAIAQRLAAAERAVERAFLQAFPGLATDALSIWEALLLVVGAEDDTQLRQLLARAWLPPKGAATPTLEESLRAISLKLSVDLETESETTTTIVGKYLAPVDNVPPFATGLSTATAAVFPGYSSTDVLRVVYTLDAGELVIPDDVTALVGDELHEALPSWQTWTLTSYTDGAPVFLHDGGLHGESVFDLTPHG